MDDKRVTSQVKAQETALSDYDFDAASVALAKIRTQALLGESEDGSVSVADAKQVAEVAQVLIAKLQGDNSEGSDG